MIDKVFFPVRCQSYKSKLLFPSQDAQLNVEWRVGLPARWEWKKVLAEECLSGGETGGDIMRHTEYKLHISHC